MEESQSPRHHCKPRLQHVMVWSNDAELVSRSVEYIKLEFEHTIYPVTIADIPTVIEKIQEHEIEKELEKYDFHLIRVYTDKIELLLRDNQQHIIKEINELEETLEIIGQRIIRWYWDREASTSTF